MRLSIDAPETMRDSLVKAVQTIQSYITKFQVVSDEDAALQDAILARPKAIRDALYTLFQGRVKSRPMKKRPHAAGRITRFFGPSMVLIAVCGNAVSADIWGRIHTTPGATVIEDRHIQFERFPLAYTVTGDLPIGKVQVFTILLATDQTMWIRRWGMEPKATFSKWTDQGVDRFVRWTPGDRIFYYAQILNQRSTYVFETGITRDQIVLKNITGVILCLAPPGQVQAGIFTNAHLVMVRLQ